jgi:hypothetical protein
MNAALSILAALISLVSAHAKTANIVDPCPSRAVIDRIEGDRVVLVHGADGVRSIAASAITAGPLALREGLRVRRSRAGQCVLEGPDRALETRVRDRLRALERANSNGRSQPR